MKKATRKSTELMKDHIIDFFAKNGSKLEQLKTLLEIRLSQVCEVYSLQHHLPTAALTVKARVKSLDSFLNKLSRKGWPAFKEPARLFHDLVGARVICWFLDDCSGIAEAIRASGPFTILENSEENYIAKPKPSGYRALHLLVRFDEEDSNRQMAKLPNSKNDHLICEIQIRTRLQDAWGDITHDLYYREKQAGTNNTHYFNFLNDISNQLLKQDKAFLELKGIYKKWPIVQS